MEEMIQDMIIAELETYGGYTSRRDDLKDLESDGSFEGDQAWEEGFGSFLFSDVQEAIGDVMQTLDIDDDTDVDDIDPKDLDSTIYKRVEVLATSLCEQLDDLIKDAQARQDD